MKDAIGALVFFAGAVLGLFGFVMLLEVLDKLGGFPFQLVAIVSMYVAALALSTYFD